MNRFVFKLILAWIFTEIPNCKEIYRESPTDKLHLYSLIPGRSIRFTASAIYSYAQTNAMLTHCLETLALEIQFTVF